MQGNTGCVLRIRQFGQQAASVLLSVRLFLRRAQAAVVLEFNHTDTSATDGRQIKTPGQLLSLRQWQDVHPKEQAVERGMVGILILHDVVGKGVQAVQQDRWQVVVVPCLQTGTYTLNTGK